mmetsp:Transcript_10503/g.16114  ORF Transcript_10503/g.16114 Transcript_10503/m.16114 type:complete len:104 (-) Transcript_10503:387-698(-)
MPWWLPILFPKGRNFSFVTAPARKHRWNSLASMDFFGPLAKEEEDRVALQSLLLLTNQKTWSSTTLEQDKSRLLQSVGQEEEPLRTILKMRIYAKQLLLQQQG